MRYTVSLSLVLFGVWLLWSGHYVPLLLTLGLISCLGVVAIVRRMDVVDHEGAPIELTHRVIAYAPWLVWEIVKANIDVARRILHPKLPVSPVLVRVKASQKRQIGQVIYANSITLTPGTVSVGVEDGVITVHALTREAAENLEAGTMDRRVAAVEGQR